MHDRYKSTGGGGRERAAGVPPPLTVPGHTRISRHQRKRKREREKTRNFPSLYALERPARFPFQIRRLIANKREPRASFSLFFPFFFLSFFFFFFQAGAPSWKNTAYRGFRRWTGNQRESNVPPYADDRKRRITAWLAGAIEFKSPRVSYDAK